MPVDDHRRKFKNLGKCDDSRRRRAEGSVELRKTRKDDHLMKRRNVELTPNKGFSSDDGEVSPAKDKDTMTPKETPKPNLTIEECMAVFKGTDPTRLLHAVESIRRLLSKQANPCIDAVIKGGVLPFLVLSLHVPDTQIQFEAAWALTNICSGTTEQTVMAVDAGALPSLVNLIGSPSLHIVDQAIWALSNVIGESAVLRDQVIDAGMLKELQKLQTQELGVEIRRNLAWTFSNLCRHKQSPLSLEVVDLILPAVVSFFDSNDTAIIMDSCWALAYLSDTSEDCIDAIIKTGILPRLVELMKSQEACHVAPALRCLGNMVVGNDAQTQAVIDSGVLEAIVPTIAQNKKSVVIKEAMWLLSNIAAGNVSQIQSILNLNLIPTVIEILKKGDHKSQYEACWVLSNVIVGGLPDQLKFLLNIQDSLLPALCGLLTFGEVRILCLVLDCIFRLLGTAQQANLLDEACFVVEECSGLNHIEMLQTHKNEDIYNKSLAIITCYFQDEDSEAEKQSPSKENNFENDSMINNGSKPTQTFDF